MICEKCQVEFDSKHSTQRFCSHECANTYRTGRTLPKEVCSRIKESLLAFYRNKPKVVHGPYEYLCEKCGLPFTREVKFRWGKKIRCPSCTRRVPYLKPMDSIDTVMQFSKRTMGKVIRRLRVGCSICGWSECHGDIHHIVPKKKGGGDSHNNLTYLCPNCHRKAHNGKILQFVSLAEQIGDRWKEMYGLR